jgi:hypothetical protein
VQLLIICLILAGGGGKIEHLAMFYGRFLLIHLSAVAKGLLLFNKSPQLLRVRGFCF